MEKGKRVKGMSHSMNDWCDGRENGGKTREVVEYKEIQIDETYTGDTEESGVMNNDR